MQAAERPTRVQSQLEITVKIRKESEWEKITKNLPDIRACGMQLKQCWDRHFQPYLEGGRISKQAAKIHPRKLQRNIKINPKKPPSGGNRNNTPNYRLRNRESTKPKFGVLKRLNKLINFW
jgi:hypothetical protein